MKKILLFFIIIVIPIMMAACGSSSGNNDPTKKGQTGGEIAEDVTDVGKPDKPVELSSEDTDEDANEDVDIDLTQLSSTMIYSQVYDMTSAPENYAEKMIKMSGVFGVYQDQETEKLYFSCVVSDATACCAQGLEFVLDGEFSYPEDYPKPGSNITITGTFDTYDENGIIYCQLAHAKIQ